MNSVLAVALIAAGLGITLFAWSRYRLAAVPFWKAAFFWKSLTPTGIRTYSVGLVVLWAGIVLLLLETLALIP